MQTLLIFYGMLKANDEIITQRVPCSDIRVMNDPTLLPIWIQEQLVRLGIGGMVHRVEDRLILTPGECFKNIWCDIPKIILADAGTEPLIKP